MSYDPSTNTLGIDPSNPGSMMADLAVSAVCMMLKMDSVQITSASGSHKAKVLREWLCVDSADLPESAMERVRMAWSAYAKVRGHDLPFAQPERFSFSLAEARQHLPPDNVMQVFDGMGLPGSPKPSRNLSSGSRQPLAHRIMQRLRRLFG